MKEFGLEYEKGRKHGKIRDKYGGSITVSCTPREGEVRYRIADDIIKHLTPTFKQENLNYG